jgi:hypothetical protein
LRDPHQTIARATALYALWRGGVVDEGDLGAMVDTVGHVEPRAEHRATYARLQEQFLAAFEALRPICTTLNA